MTNMTIFKATDGSIFSSAEAVERYDRYVSEVQKVNDEFFSTKSKGYSNSLYSLIKFHISDVDKRLPWLEDAPDGFIERMRDLTKTRYLTMINIDSIDGVHDEDFKVIKITHRTGSQTGLVIHFAPSPESGMHYANDSMDIIRFINSIT